MRGPEIIWLLFISWMVHDLEEILFFDRLDLQSDPRVRGFSAQSPLVRSIIQSRSGSQKENRIAIFLMGLLILGAAAAGYFHPQGWGMVVYGVFLGGYSLHSLTHLAQTLAFGKYTPGLVTALTVVLPSSLIIYSKLIADQLLTTGNILTTAFAGMIIFVPLVVIINRTSKVLVKLG